MTHRLRFTRQSDGTPDLSERALADIVATLRETGGPEPLLSEDAMAAASREFNNATHALCAGDMTKYNAAAASIVRTRPNLYYLTRGRATRDVDADVIA